MTEYNANSIKILDEAEISRRFPFTDIAEIASNYKTPVECVQRAYEAACVVGYDFDLYIARYLEGDKTVPICHEFQEAYKEMMKGGNK